MAILKFRIYLEEEDTVYRDVLIRHNQNFLELHYVILEAFEFDNKHQATFFRSNEIWQRGREISFDVYDKKYAVSPLMMRETVISSEVQETNQKFVYLYDFEKNWSFLVELINISKEEDPRISYPAISRKEGIGPKQYSTNSILGDKFTEIEEKYDLTNLAEGFGKEGETELGEIEGHEEESDHDEFKQDADE